MSLDVAYAQELAAHDTEIEDINAEAFGPGRFARAAYKIREGGPHRRDLSFVGLVDGKVVASVRMTPIAAGGATAARPSGRSLRRWAGGCALVRLPEARPPQPGSTQLR